MCVARLTLSRGPVPCSVPAAVHSGVLGLYGAPRGGALGMYSAPHVRSLLSVATRGRLQQPACGLRDQEVPLRWASVLCAPCVGAVLCASIVAASVHIDACPVAFPSMLMPGQVVGRAECTYAIPGLSAPHPPLQWCARACA